jgi:hypothetical protein
MNTWIKEFEPITAWCDETYLCAKLKSGVTIKVPIWWYPTLAKANLQQRNQIECSYSGLHWEEIDEDISIKNMLYGQKAKGAVAPEIAIAHINAAE